MTFTSPREHQLWTAAAGYFAAILAAAYFVRFGVDALRRHGWLTATFWTLAAAIGIGLLLAALRARPGWRQLVVLLATGSAYVVAFHQLRQIEERLHLFEYGLLAILVEAALRAREPARPLRAAGLAAALTAAAGWLDELWQGLLPNRYYDLRDVGFNAGAAVLALAALAAWRRAARRPPSVAFARGSH
jgi:hypothetical protein